MDRKALTNEYQISAQSGELIVCLKPVHKELDLIGRDIVGNILKQNGMKTTAWIFSKCAWL